DTGSIFVQISDENIHRVQLLLDEVFGKENFSCIITYAKTTSTTGADLSSVNDYILWYFKDSSKPKRKMLFKDKRAGEAGGTGYNKVMLANGELTTLSRYDGTTLGCIPGLSLPEATT
ncbi:MAG: site-specific DNA-methyltransferase, partial [Proteobacteria bacterium]|nr:site-specific DNA-methyltransferase [Pseudomonadota bacterium]